MPRHWNAFAFVLVMGTTLMAHAADPVADADRLKESLAKWEQVRKECGGDYSYQVRWSSFAGFGHVTTVTVKGNKVVERKYEELSRPEPVEPGKPPAAPKPKWVETGKDLGSHKKEGALARTLDDLYAEAKKLVAMQVPENHRRQLGFDKQGLLNYCFTVDTRIADDAPMTGIAPFQIQFKKAK